MTLELNFKIRPQPHQSFRVGRGGIKYKPKKIVDYQKEVVRLAKEMLPQGFNIIKAGTEIIIKELTYTYEYPKALPNKRKIRHFKTTKPDLADNLNKAFLDALEGLIYEQDQNIVLVEKLSKVYDKEDGIKLVIDFVDN